MPHTSKDRDKVGICGARKKNGETCRAFAGQGTDHLGIGRCKFHGGSTRNHRLRATVVQAQRDMIKFGAAFEIHPHEALLRMLHLAAGHVAWLRVEIGELDDLSGDEGRILTTLYGEERDRVAKVAKACLDAGVAERQVAIAEQYGAQLADVLRAIFSDPELGLSASQRAALPSVAARYLHHLEAPALLSPARRAS